MATGPNSRELRSVFTRQALGFGLVATLALVAMALFTAQAFERARDDALQRLVDTDLAALADIYATSGRDELIARVEDRLALGFAEKDAVHFMLVDARGQRLAGDLSRWPSLSPQTSQAGYVSLAGGVPAYARATQLAPHVKLAVAHEFGSWTRLRAVLWRTLGLALLTAVAVLVLFAARSARHLRSRTLAIVNTFDSYRSGQSGARVRGPFPPDEIGEIALNSNRLLDRVNELVRGYRDISDHVAHEIRTPLGHLDNRLLAMAGQVDKETAERLLAPARRDIRKTVTLLDSLLDISASEAQRGETAGLEPVDLSDLVAGLADLYADSAEDRGFEFEVDISPEIIILGDAMQLSRMVSNLLDNAFKYTPAKGGRIELMLSAGPVLKVADNGPGVPEAMRKAIFERFHRGGKEGQKGQGHGLGLALAQAIAQRHRLVITVEQAGAGACFMVQPETAKDGL